MEYSTKGTHVVADLWGFENTYMDNQIVLDSIARTGARKSGAKVLSSRVSRNSNGDCSVLVLLSESHLSIHTYPSMGFIHIDCYTCGDHVNPLIAVEYIMSKFKPPRSKIVVWDRGIEPTTIAHSD